jgi:DNA segregation ATPase FtsK/SpoIIIE, S-DNA-T family
MNDPSTSSGHSFYQQTASAIADYLWQELKIHPRRSDYRIAAATSGPRVLSLSILVNPRHAPRIMSLAEQLSMAAGLNQHESIRIVRGKRGSLALEIPKPRWMWYNVPVTALPPRRGLLTSVGLDGEHRPALVDFANPLTPHCLVAGTTGSGKTNTQRVLIYDLAKQNPPDAVRFLLIDTRKRGSAWHPFARLPHLIHTVVTEDEEALRSLAWAVAEIDRRALSGQKRPRVFIGIDEAQALLDRGEFVKPISDLAAVGREFGIHVLVALQNPTAAQLGDASIKRNLTARLVGRVDSAQAANVAAGVKGSGAELLTGAGDMLMVLPAGVRRMTAALLTERDTDGLPRAEQVGSLDLDEYEDVDHVLDQADSQGKADPLDPVHVAWSLAHPGASQHSMRQQFKIGFTKIRRVQAFARSVLEELTQLGFAVHNSTTAQQHGDGDPL